MRREARQTIAWCLAQPGWWRTRDVAQQTGCSLDTARKQMLRLDWINVIQRGELNGRIPLWRIRDRELGERLANKQPKRQYPPKAKQ